VSIEKSLDETHNANGPKLNEVVRRALELHRLEVKDLPAVQ
jgi:hypothetical protein